MKSLKQGEESAETKQNEGFRVKMDKLQKKSKKKNQI